MISRLGVNDEDEDEEDGSKKESSQSEPVRIRRKTSYTVPFSPDCRTGGSAEFISNAITRLLF